MQLWYKLEISDIIHQLSTHEASGLSSDEAYRRLIEHGHNELNERNERSAWRIL
jgi:magnesium-transporting ATPase (P-type)